MCQIIYFLIPLFVYKALNGIWNKLAHKLYFFYFRAKYILLDNIWDYFFISQCEVDCCSIVYSLNLLFCFNFSKSSCLLSFISCPGLTSIGKKTQVQQRSPSQFTPPLKAVRTLARPSWRSCRRKPSTQSCEFALKQS